MVKKNAAVFYGGKSSEHDISIITAVQVMNSLDCLKYNIIPVYMGRSGKWFTGGAELKNIASYGNSEKLKLKEVFLKPESNILFCKKAKPLCKIDVALVCCHGLNGEDGTLQGVLELSNIPYTSGGVLACGMGMDKIAAKMVFKSAGLRVLPYTYLTKSEFDTELYAVVKRIKGRLRFPLIIKPANLGSSIGISIAKDGAELIEGLRIAFKFDHRVIIENALTDFFELNCSVLGYGADVRASVIEQPLSWKEFLTFDEKYMSGDKTKGLGGLKRKLPADIDPKTEAKIKKAAQKAFKVVNGKGVVRVDFIVDKQTDKFYINEINTIPGSLSFYLWEYSGMNFDTLLEKLIQIAYLSWADKNSLEYAYKSGVLQAKERIRGKG